MKVGGSGSITQSSTTHTSGGGVGLPSPKHHQDQLAVHQMRARAGLLERDDSGSSLSHHTHSTEPDNMRHVQQSNTPGSARSASDSVTYSR